MKILHLSLKKQWYEMIESGVKTEEYREIKEHWVKRLTHFTYEEFETLEELTSNLKFTAKGEWTPQEVLGYYGAQLRCFDAIKFSYGYTKRTMTFECKGITIGVGCKEWGAPNEDVFIIKLGNRIE